MGYNIKNDFKNSRFNEKKEEIEVLPRDLVILKEWLPTKEQKASRDFFLIKRFFAQEERLNGCLAVWRSLLSYQ